MSTPPPTQDGPAVGRPGVVSVIPLPGLPEVRAGDDLVGLLLDGIAAAGERLRDGDVLAVTSKVVAKAEGRLVPLPADAAERERVHRETVAAETVRVVARRGRMVIAETRHGLVGANALIDASNAGGDALVPLPEDPDASAARLRAGLAAATGADLAVVVTDTLGRPWRLGQTDVAVGLAGMGALADYRGRPDNDGRVLEVTETAVPDEVAAAADLVKGKLARVPAALVRGVARPPGAGTARDLVRPAADDLFRTAGAPEELLAFLEGTGRPAAPLPDPVDPALVSRAVEAAALAAPAPAPPLVRISSAAARERWLAATRPQDQDAPTLPGLGPAAGSGPAPARGQDPGGPQRTAAAALAPVLLVPCLAGDGPADELAAGAFTQALLLALRAQGMAAVWIPAVPSRRQAGAAALDLHAGWLPLGAVAAGRSGPDAAPPPAARPAPGLIDR